VRSGLDLEASDAVAALLGRVPRPYDASRVLAAAAGMTLRHARHVTGLLLATTAEAERLLDQMPRIVRSLAIATADRPTRCYGELRGPVLWSETMSARSASAGDPGLFVCATTRKAYDTDENRVLKAALDLVHRAGRDADHSADPDDVRRARASSARAGRFGDHQTLDAVPVVAVRGRTLQRARSGSRRGTYAPAIAVLTRAGDLLSAATVLPHLDEAAKRDLTLMAAVVEELAGRYGQVLPLRTSGGALVYGPVRYEHRAIGRGGAGVTVSGRVVSSRREATDVLDQT